MTGSCEDSALLSEREAFGRAWDCLDVLSKSGVRMARAELYVDGSGRLIVPADQIPFLTDEVALSVSALAGSARWSRWDDDSDLTLSSCQGFRVSRDIL